MDRTELANWCRGRAKYLEGMDKRILHAVANALEAGGGEVTREAVLKWLAERDLALLPWQKKKLGLE